MITRDDLHALTHHIDATDTECDGASRLVHLALTRAGVIHQPFVGRVDCTDGRGIRLHYWIRVGSWLIDYRARMWLGSDAPHGVFLPGDYPDFRYIGKPTSFTMAGCLVMERIAQCAR